MKKKSAMTLLAFLIVVSLTGAATAAQAADPVTTIRQHYSAINMNQAKYKQVKKDLLGFSTEGGELVVYRDGPAIVKMVATFYGESGQAFEEYYYRKAQLIFVYRKQSHYDKPLSGRVVSSQEQRFYFNKGKLIKWLDEKGKSVTRGKESSRKQQELLHSSREFTDGARSNATSIEASRH